MRFRAFWLGLLVLAAFLFGCNSEKLTYAPVVINGGQELPSAAVLSGANGFSVAAEQVLKVLGGTMDEIDKDALLVTLKGQRILLSPARRPDVQHDLQVDLPIERLGGTVQLYGSQLSGVITAAYPNGKAYRKGDKVYIVTGE